MKLAVIFLCLSVACFIGTSKGTSVIGGKAKSLDKSHLSVYVVYLFQIGSLCSQKQNYSGCDLKLRNGIIAGFIYELLIIFSKDCGLDLRAVLTALDCTLDQITAILAHDLVSILEFIVTVLLGRVVILVQAVFAQAGCLLRDEVAGLCIKVGVNVTIVVGSLPGLVASITLVAGTMSNTLLLLLNGVLVTVFGLLESLNVGAILNGLLGPGGGLVGGLLGTVGGVVGGLVDTVGGVVHTVGGVADGITGGLLGGAGGLLGGAGGILG